MTKEKQNQFPERRIPTTEVNLILPFDVPLKLLPVPGGDFMMGSPSEEFGRGYDEEQHLVTIPKQYWMAETPVTQAQWRAVTQDNPSYFEEGDEYPVENITYWDAVKFCDEVNLCCRGSLPAGYRVGLPTEAMWEKACRGGTSTALNSGLELTCEKDSNLAALGWYNHNSDRHPHPVRQKQPNAFSLFDMLGLIWEFCSDLYGSYDNSCLSSTLGPIGAQSGFLRVIRGGSWYSSARSCRSASRCSFSSDSHSYALGFRLALLPVA